MGLYRELMSSSTVLSVSIICSSQNVRTILYFTPSVFLFLGCPYVQMYLWFVHEVQPHYQLLNGIHGPLHSPTKENPLGLWWRGKRAKGLIRPAQFICLVKTYSITPSIPSAPLSICTNLLKEHVWL